MSLVSQIKIAIATGNVSKAAELKEVCDILHNGGIVDKYTPADLPSDAIYEQLNKLITSAETTITLSAVQDDSFPELWMGSVPKFESIKAMVDGIMMPKYDGCSCGIRLKQTNGEFTLETAVTRGVKHAYETVKTNITDKVRMILSDMPKIPLDVEYAYIRGEIVLKDKRSCSTAPASIVAGKINGSKTVWDEYVSNIEFIPYEIMRFVKFDGAITIPSQSESLEMLGVIHKRVSLTSDSLPVVQEYFNELRSTILEPIDGIVYCPADWVYPSTMEQTHASKYGKYAWKPISETTTVLTEITTSISRDGKINFMAAYNTVQLNGKQYKKAKVALKHLLGRLHGIGIGSVITVKLAKDISPFIDSFEPNDEIQPYQLPNSCPECGSPLFTSRASNAWTMTCRNEACYGRLVQKYMFFLKEVGIKGIGEAKIRSVGSLCLNDIIGGLRYNDKLVTTPTNAFLVAAGIGTKKRVDAELDLRGINGLVSIGDNIRKVYEAMAPIKDTFITDIMLYMLYIKEIPIPGFNC